MVKYHAAKSAAAAILGDARILAGGEIGPSGEAWPDVAGTLEVNLRCVANWLREQRIGNCPEAIAPLGAVAEIAAILAGEE